MEESKAEKMGNGGNGTLATHQKSKKARKIACCYQARTGTKHLRAVENGPDK